MSEIRQSFPEDLAEIARLQAENARLAHDLGEAREHQAATSEVLQIISGSPTGVQLVFDAICSSAARVCHASDATLRLLELGLLRRVARFGEMSNRTDAFRLDRDTPQGRAMLERRSIHVQDIQAEMGPGTDFPAVVQVDPTTLVPGWSALLVPLLAEEAAIGVLGVRRGGMRPFTSTEIKLLETFAAQAVIAMENARLYEELQAVSQHKSDFLSHMSHELRTPLNAVISFAEIVAEDATDAGDEQYLEDLAEITTAGKHLLGLINDILDLSKIEAGRMDILIEEFEVAGLVHEVQAMALPLVEKKGNRLVVECPPDLGTMHSDVSKARQSLLNFLSNAAKFTEQGTVTLRVTGDGPLPQALP